MAAVKEIEIKGQRHPVRYDVNSYCEFEEITGRSLISGFAFIDVRCMRALVYVGLKSGYKFAYQGNKTFEKSLEDVGELIDLKDGTLKQFVVALHESLGISETDQDENTRSAESPGNLKA